MQSEYKEKQEDANGKLQSDIQSKYNSRVTEIEQGTFTPLVFTTTEGMADECLRYHSRLAEL
ncbi:unnamed protein product, partial [Porites evermanni]